MNFEVGKIYLTECGQRVKILETDVPGNYPLMGRFLQCGSLGQWLPNGSQDLYGNFPLTTRVFQELPIDSVDE